MPRPAIVNLIAHAARGERRKGIAVLDGMTPWRGVAEVAADLAAPPMYDAIERGVQGSRAALVAALRELADELEAAG